MPCAKATAGFQPDFVAASWRVVCFPLTSVCSLASTISPATYFTAGARESQKPLNQKAAEVLSYCISAV
jgi:hypothetical protein